MPLLVDGENASQLIFTNYSPLLRMMWLVSTCNAVNYYWMSPSKPGDHGLPPGLTDLILSDIVEIGVNIWMTMKEVIMSIAALT